MDINQVDNSNRSHAIAGELYIKLTYLLTKIDDNDNDNKPKKQDNCNNRE